MCCIKVSCSITLAVHYPLHLSSPYWSQTCITLSAIHHVFRCSGKALRQSCVTMLAIPPLLGRLGTASSELFYVPVLTTSDVIKCFVVQSRLVKANLLTKFITHWTSSLTIIRLAEQQIARLFIRPWAAFDNANRSHCQNVTKEKIMKVDRLLLTAWFALKARRSTNTIWVFLPCAYWIFLSAFHYFTNCSFPHLCYLYSLQNQKTGWRVFLRLPPPMPLLSPSLWRIPTHRTHSYASQYDIGMERYR